MRECIAGIGIEKPDGRPVMLHPFTQQEGVIRFTGPGKSEIVLLAACRKRQKPLQGSCVSIQPGDPCGSADNDGVGEHNGRQRSRTDAELGSAGQSRNRRRGTGQMPRRKLPRPVGFRRREIGMPDDGRSGLPGTVLPGLQQTQSILLRPRQNAQTLPLLQFLQ